MKILIVEDDKIISDTINLALRSQDYFVDSVFDGSSADLLLKQNEYDILILDLGLPTLDGIDVLLRLRQRKNEIPVLIISSRESFSEKTKVLDLGADDYMVKPVNTQELSARIRSIVRRRYFILKSEISIGNLTYNSLKKRFFIGDSELKLSCREFTILDLLIRNAGRILNKETILDRICTGSEELNFNSIEVYISRLRKKLNHSGVQLITIRGLGYLIDPLS